LTERNAEIREHHMVRMMKPEETIMPHHSLSDYMTTTIAAILVIASLALLMLYPDLPGLAVSVVNLGLSGVLLLSGAALQDRNALAWERIALAAWLALSPWLIGVSEVSGVTWFSIVCATFVFVPAATLVSQPWAFGKAKALGSFPTYAPSNKKHM
jgi:hypothetical protein